MINREIEKILTEAEQNLSFFFDNENETLQSFNNELVNLIAGVKTK